MIKQIPSKDIKVYVKNNPKSIILDVRTKSEWEQVGKPDGEKIGSKTFFLTLQFEGGIMNKNFLKEFDDLNISKDCEILTLCGAGGRSQMAAEILTKEGRKCSNISDGFNGNTEDPGWKNSGLPIK